MRFFRRRLATGAGEAGDRGTREAERQAALARLARLAAADPPPPARAGGELAVEQEVDAAFERIQHPTARPPS